MADAWNIYGVRGCVQQHCVAPRLDFVPEGIPKLPDRHRLFRESWDPEGAPFFGGDNDMTPCTKCGEGKALENETKTCQDCEDRALDALIVAAMRGLDPFEDDAE